MSEDTHGEGAHAESLYPIARWFERVLESQASSNLLIIVFILLAAIPILGIGIFTTRPIAPVDAMQVPSQESAASGVVAQFTCAEGRTVTAIFSGNQVQLSLSDGRQITLPQAPAASGARYSNTDGSFVFWGTGRSARIEENSAATYSGCVAQS